MSDNQAEFGSGIAEIAKAPLSKPHLSRLHQQSEEVWGRKIRKHNRRKDDRSLSLQIAEGLEDWETQKSEEQEFAYERWDDWDPQEVAIAQVDREIAGSDTNGSGIVPYVPFDPRKELRGIRHLSPPERQLPKSERKEIVRDRIIGFESDLLAQQERIAELVMNLGRQVAIAPDLTAEQLMSYVDRYAASAFLTSEQLNLFRNALTAYEAKHRFVNLYYHNNPPEVLFENCFGAKPEGRLIADIGPMTLRFYLNDEDYTKARMYYKTQGDVSVITQDDRLLSQKSGGVALSEVGIGKLSGTVAAIKGHPSDKGIATVVTHEDQHQFNKLFSPVEYYMSVDQLFSATMAEGDRAQKIQNFVYYYTHLQRRVMGVDARARDEMIAYFADGRSVGEIFNVLTSNSLYDIFEIYKKPISRIRNEIKLSLAQCRQYLFEREREWHDQNGVLPEDISPELVDAAVQRVFKADYQRDLKRWLQAMTILEEKGYTIAETLGILYSQPTSSWRSVVRRQAAKPGHQQLEKAMRDAFAHSTFDLDKLDGEM